jgi:anti-sigma regulatory factor (Ser/Thr protein kinase)
MIRTRSFSCAPESVASARRFATEMLRGTPTDVLDSVELMVSELATNSIRHAGTAFELSVTLVGNEIRIEVTDQSGGQPQMRRAGPDDPTGRGLQIVNLLSDAWGVEHGGALGKTVWFKVSTAPAIGPGPRGTREAASR